MGKRSDFPRRPQDDYATPLAALEPLLPHLYREAPIIEPCPGARVLHKHLEEAGFLVANCEEDARIHEYGMSPWGKDFIFVTNPPWTRAILHPIIENLSNQATTWLLFDADWMHCKQAIPYLPRLRQVVSVGRVKWIPDSLYVGKDNACWYRFGTPSEFVVTRFFGRTA
jgi:hypothetical protein